jgi:hypothetical protein
MCQCDDLDMMAVAAAGATPGQKGAIIQRTHLLALLIRCRLKAPVVATPRHRGFSRRRRAPAALGTPHGWFWVLLLLRPEAWLGETRESVTVTSRGFSVRWRWGMRGCSKSRKMMATDRARKHPLLFTYPPPVIRSVSVTATGVGAPLESV